MSDNVEAFITDSFKGAWDLFIKYPVPYILAFILVAVVGTLTLGILAGPLAVNYINMIRTGMAGDEPKIDQLWAFGDILVPALLTGILMGIAVTLGFIFLVLPGIALILLFTFAFHELSYRPAGPVEAIKASVQIVLAEPLNVLLLVIVGAFANILGNAIVVGVLVTGPITAIAYTIGYESLVGVE